MKTENELNGLAGKINSLNTATQINALVWCKHGKQRIYLNPQWSQNNHPATTETMFIEDGSLYGRPPIRWCADAKTYYMLMDALNMIKALIKQSN